MGRSARPGVPGAIEGVFKAKGGGLGWSPISPFSFVFCATARVGVVRHGTPREAARLPKPGHLPCGFGLDQRGWLELPTGRAAANEALDPYRANLGRPATRGS